VDDRHLDERLRAIAGNVRVSRHAPLAPLTTFKVGGPADWLVDVSTEGELLAVLAAARDAGAAVTILGGGSNVLIGDRGIRGVVIRPRLTAIDQPAPGLVRAEAGVTINGLVRWTIARGLGSLEAWAGTPGTVGGAIAGNAHFGGRNIGDLVARVAVVTAGGGVSVLDRSGMAFGYDSSRITRTHEVVLWAEFDVWAAPRDRLRETARASLAHRKKTQPLDRPSAGCVFQNPDPARDAVPAGIPASAGALIDRAGLKGRRVGGAHISPAHGNFVVNDGHATASDIRAVIELARSGVRDRFGVELRDEVVLLGEF